MTQPSPQPSPHLPPTRPRPRRSPGQGQPTQGQPSPLPAPGVVALAAPVPAQPPAQPPVPLTAQPSPARVLGQALQALGLLLSATSEGALPWRVVGAFGGPYAGHRFALSRLEDGEAMIRELPAHLGAPPVWTAALGHLARTVKHTPGTERDATGLLAWTAGYAAARRHFFTSRGAFIPLHAARRQDVPCPYAGEAEHQTFLVGVGAYLSAVRLSVQDARLSAPLQFLSAL